MGRVRPKILLLLSALAASAAFSLPYVRAQEFDPRRPRTFTIGPPPGASPTERVSAARDGFTRTPLPTGSLHIAWKRSLGSGIEHAPVVDASGMIYALSARGEVAAFVGDGAEAWRVSTGALQGGPPALLSDGTLFFVGGAGDAIGVRAGAVRFKVRVAREGGAPRVAPLALDDGGVVYASGPELVVLDGDGNVRTRAALPEVAAAPLLSALGRVVIIGSTGTTYLWSPGGEVDRVGSFESALDGAAALADAHTLLAVTSSNRQLTALDLARGLTTPRAVAPAGFYLGPIAVHGGTAHLLAVTPTSSLLLAIDGSGQEVGHAVLASLVPQPGADGGAPVAVIPAHTGPLVDAAGTVAFAGAEGQAGVLSTTGIVETVADTCSGGGFGPGRSPIGLGGAQGATGLAPAGPGAFVVACGSGTLAKVSGS